MKKNLIIVITVCLLWPGFIQGEATHPQIKDFEAKLLKARLVDLSQVRLLGGPLKKAQEVDAQYLLQLEPDRMLAYYRQRAGLPPKAEPYDGWDGGGRNLTGHLAGHYLSAVSLMYAATGDERFKERADYIVKELKEVQDKHGDGYLSALEGGREAFERLALGEIQSRAFDLNGLWSPWYTLHKTFAGLRDAYRYTGNKIALEIEVRFAEWVERTLANLTPAQIQHMLHTEFGGMNEVLVDLYADTGDQRWLDLSFKFEHDDFLRPLQRHQDNLAWKHGNTQVPKLIGSADRFGYTGKAADIIAASFFFDQVAQHHSFATGGHGKDEYFGPPDQLSDFIVGRTAETCNVYNMVKLARRLFEFFPDAHYADFQERALFNHILASLDPETGRMCYMVPVGQGVQHEYQNMFRSFTCCVGTGMESHALHGSGIYYQGENKLWVNLYVPSELNWEEMGAKLRMKTDFPEGEEAVLELSLSSPQKFTLLLRCPYWVEKGFVVLVNGERVFSDEKRSSPDKSPESSLYSQEIPGYPLSSSYVALERTWQDGDQIEIKLPKTFRLEPLLDNPRRAAILWGPLVLAGDLGPEIPRSRWTKRQASSEEIKLKPVPVFVAAHLPPSEWIKPVPGEPGHFRTVGVGREEDVDLYPFYRLHRRRYALYWDLFTPQEWEKEQQKILAEKERLKRLEEATVVYIQPGEIQEDRNYNYQGENSFSLRVKERSGRGGRGWFSYDVAYEATQPAALVVTYYSGPTRRGVSRFKICIDGQLLKREEIKYSPPARFFDVEYPLPAQLVKDKKKLTIRFEAEEGSEISPVFCLRLIRK